MSDNVRYEPETYTVYVVNESGRYNAVCVGLDVHDMLDMYRQLKNAGREVRVSSSFDGFECGIMLESPSAIE